MVMCFTLNGAGLAGGICCSCSGPFVARMRPTGRADQCPELGVKRTQRRRRRWAVADRACVKTHTSAKCRKHNSPARHRTSLVQYDLTPADAIAQRYFYVWRDRWSFRTAKTQSGQGPDRNLAVQQSAGVLLTCVG